MGGMKSFDDFLAAAYDDVAEKCMAGMRDAMDRALSRAKAEGEGSFEQSVSVLAAGLGKASIDFTLSLLRAYHEWLHE